MTRWTVGIAALLCAALVGGCEDEEPEALPTEVAETPPPAEQAEAPEPEPGVQAPAAGELPMAADVLPSGEVSQGSRAVLADGYRFQIPDGFAAAEVDVEGAEHAYGGDVDGIIRPSHLTIYVTKEPFSGSTSEYADQQQEQQGQVEGNEIRPIGPAFMKAGGQQAQGTRWRVENEQTIEMQQVYVHEGTAYTFHCVMPKEPMNWSNVGSDCMIKGTTFHIAPPAE